MPISPQRSAKREKDSQSLGSREEEEKEEEDGRRAARRERIIPFISTTTFEAGIRF